ncbi:hypothetical protein PIB30_061090 [Stylosanthes scabra]|uniref:Secreted protein n=1 Tax=Stylosanthes scabra TaxID=79078 RepID=A0ABU6TKH6_9FABA|nr:hypothetical protein [Stylosanthes scabra]
MHVVHCFSRFHLCALRLPLHDGAASDWSWFTAVECMIWNRAVAPLAPPAAGKFGGFGGGRFIASSSVIPRVASSLWLGAFQSTFPISASVV